MSIYVELEIQNLLKQIGNSEEALGQVAEQLINDLEKDLEKLTAENIEALARFLLQAGQYIPLIEFIGRHLEREDFQIPWAYLIEALFRVHPDLDKKLQENLLEGIEETKSHDKASRTKALDKFEPEMANWRNDRKYRLHREYTNNKKILLDQLITLRTQQLFEQEKKLLARLNKLYPNDSEIKHEQSEHKQRYALEILARRGPASKNLKAEAYNPRDLEVEKVIAVLHDSILQAAAQDPSIAEDLAVAAIMFEMPETALQVIDLAPASPHLTWLRMEILLLCRHFVELLNEIARAELLFSHEAETFFATAYLRAQALWGLGQKHTAMEVMEGILISRPQYRAASALLSIWGQQ